MVIKKMADFNPILVGSLTRLYHNEDEPTTYHNDELLDRLLANGAITEEDKIKIILGEEE